MEYDQLSASDGTGEAVLANIESDRAIGAITLNVDSVENFPNQFIFATGTKNANNFITPATMTVGYGHVDSGDVIIDGFAPGYEDDGNTAGQILVIKPTTYWADEIVRLARVAHNDDGTLKESQLGDGWRTLNSTLSVATGYNKGNKSFVLDSSADLTGVVSPGMRLKVARDVAAPTQSADFESASSQYANKTSPSGITFTDDFTVEAWIKVESITADSQSILARRVASTQGWQLCINNSGQVFLTGILSSGNRKDLSSYCSVPTGRWVHVAASLNMSASTGTIYIDGSLVASFVTTSGTANSLTQAGNLDMGAYNSASAAGHFADMKMADVRLWNTIRTQTQIQDNMNQQLVGNESGLIGYWKLNGNFQDSSASANNLTAQASVTATNLDNPMKDTEYAIITKVTASQLTVFTGTDHAIPNMTLETPAYSRERDPFNFPSARNKWIVEVLNFTGNFSQSSPVSGTYYDTGDRLEVPIGAWNISFLAHTNTGANASHQARFITALSTSNNSQSSTELAQYQSINLTTGGVTNAFTIPFVGEDFVELTAATWFYIVVATFAAGMPQISFSTSNNRCNRIVAECAYV